MITSTAFSPLGDFFGLGDGFTEVVAEPGVAAEFGTWVGTATVGRVGCGASSRNDVKVRRSPAEPASAVMDSRGT